MKNKIAAIVLVTVVISAGLIMLTEAGATTTTAPEEAWNRTFGGTLIDSAKSVQQTSDGGYILAGGTTSWVDYSMDFWLIKTDSNGNKLWNKTFGGTHTDSAKSVQQTVDGGYIIAGSTASHGDPVHDAWLIKTNSKGNKEWDQTFGRRGYYECAYFVQQTSDGGYIFVGWTHPGGQHKSSNVWLVKTDSNGNKLWETTFGGSARDIAHSVQQTTDGGYILAGQTRSYGAGNVDVWLIKTDSNGNKLWNKTFGGTGWYGAYSVQQTVDGGYIIAGTLEADPFTGSSWLIKVDSDGNEQWDKTFGGADYDGAKSVQQTADGGYILAGYTESFGAGDEDFWLVKTDSNGNKEWDKTFGGADYDWAYSVRQTVDGGYILAGTTSSYGAGGSDAWLIKVGGSGEGTINAPDIEKPPEKSIPGFGALGAMVSIGILIFLRRRRS